MISGHCHHGHREQRPPRVTISGHRISARTAPIPVPVAHTSAGDISPMTSHTVPDAADRAAGANQDRTEPPSHKARSALRFGVR